MKKIIHIFSFVAIIFLPSFLGSYDVRAAPGAVTLPGFGGSTEALNRAVTPNLRGQGGTGNSGLVPCGFGDNADAAEECQFDDLILLAKNVMNFLLFVIAVPIAAVSFAWAGWLYLSAAGNESKVKQAHEIFGYVVLGLCIALAAWLIVNALVIGLGVGSKYNFLGTT
jgi:hypothetical protein